MISSCMHIHHAGMQPSPAPLTDPLGLRGSVSTTAKGQGGKEMPGYGECMVS